MPLTRRRGSTRIVAILVVAWLVIGALAAVQRHYFSSGKVNCAHTGTVLVTILAGPLNYIGANPKIKCNTPQPSN
jgi:DNA-binding transcriptional regulator of glucitol operon